jgi:hypothetical protein
VGGKRHYISIPALLLLVLFYDQAFLKNFHLERTAFGKIEDWGEPIGIKKNIMRAQQQAMLS